MNPSLTITAQAERAMAFWPNKGEADPRPALGTTYRPVAAVAPAHPVVPESAPGALRLPDRGRLLTRLAARASRDPTRNSGATGR